MIFLEKLETAARVNGSWLCVGLDPDPSLMPIADVAAFNAAIIEATADLVCAYKPNIAFYEAMGKDGMAALEKTAAAVPKHIPIIIDAKRGDIGNTAKAYARALFETWGFDAATVSPYLGYDSLEPFLAYADKAVFILCRTSNSGGSDLQNLLCSGPEGAPARPLYQVVASKANEWNRLGNVGLVVGAPYPDELRQIRAICPDLPILIPGVGAQGGDLELSAKYGSNERGERAIINSSRQVLYASRGADYADAARAVARKLRDDISQALRAR